MFIAGKNRQILVSRYAHIGSSIDTGASAKKEKAHIKDGPDAAKVHRTRLEGPVNLFLPSFCLLAYYDSMVSLEDLVLPEKGRKQRRWTSARTQTEATPPDKVTELLSRHPRVGVIFLPIATRNPWCWSLLTNSKLELPILRGRTDQRRLEKMDAFFVQHTVQKGKS